MTPQDIKQHLLSIGTPLAGVEKVLRAFENAPVRKLDGRGGAVRVEYYSKKMDCMLICESASVEFEMAQELERDPDVLAYCLQPLAEEMQFGDGGKGTTRTKVTPDALVVAVHGVFLDEWKPTDRHLKLPAVAPNRYRRDADGHVISPAMVQKFAPLGITHRLRHPGHLPRKYLENVEYLKDYAGAEAPALSDDIKQRISELMQVQAFRTFKDLLDLEPALSVDLWLRAIVEGIVVVDIERERLADQHTAFVYRDEITMQVMRRERDVQIRRLAGVSAFQLIDGMSFVLDGRWYEVVTVGDTEAILKGDDDRNVSLPIAVLENAFLISKLKVESIPCDTKWPSKLAQAVATATSQELQDAKRKLDIVEGRLPSEGTPSRTLREWCKLVKLAHRCGEDALVGLLPARDRQGNHGSRVVEEHDQLISKVLNNDYFQPHRPSLVSVHKIYVEACEGKWTPLSRQSFGKRAKAASDDAANFKRYGKRLAYAMKPAYVAAAYEPSVHGNRPFAVVHIDHTQVDLELRSESDGEPLGRPWLSIAFDAATRSVLAWVISFRAPDTHTVMLLLRAMVKRHQRLPAMLVIDNGADLRSRTVSQFCAAFGVNLKRRPPGQPRFGSVIERMFGTISTAFFHTLRGSTKVMKAVRTVTGACLPSELSHWHFRHLKTALAAWFEEVYHETPHSGLDGEVPREALQKGLLKHGAREHKRVLCDEAFRILTCPFVKTNKGQRMIDRRTGVKVDERYYHAPELRDPQVDGATADVRRDPEDIDVVYVLVKRNWVKCRRVGNAEARGMNEWELQLYSEELMQRKLINKEQANDPAKVRREARMCNLIASLETDAKSRFRKLREEGLISGDGESASSQKTESQVDATPPASDTPIIEGSKAPEGNGGTVYYDGEF